MQLDSEIAKFNQTYGLYAKDGDDYKTRIKHFKSISTEEVEECEAILEKIDKGAEEIDVATDLADWLGDLLIYCASEMDRYGIPIEKTLQIIMESNMSKLGQNGKPIYDERGKLLKGPFFQPPEPKLKAMLQNLF